MRRTLGATPDNSETLGMDMMEMMMDMPVISIFYFNPDAMKQTPEEVLEGMLARVRGS
jgi:hypothetical protein